MCAPIAVYGDATLWMEGLGSIGQGRYLYRKLDAAKRCEIAKSVVTGRKSGADMARLYGVSQPTVSRIVVSHLAARLSVRFWTDRL